MYSLKIRRLSELEAAKRQLVHPSTDSRGHVPGQGAPMFPVDLPTSAKPQPTGLSYFCPLSFCQTFKILINPNSDPRITGEDGWGNRQPLTFTCICPATANLLKINWGGTCWPAPVPAWYPFIAFPKLKVSPSAPNPLYQNCRNPPPLQKPVRAEHLLNYEVKWGMKRGSLIQWC